MSNKKWHDRWVASVASSYAAPTLTLVKGDGVRVWDADGNVYADLIAGIAVNTLGHAHPALVRAITEQVQTLSHVSNLYANAPAIELSERLLELHGERGATGKVFLCNSGTEANEAAFKIARLTGRAQIVATERAFHGRTMGALAMTGQSAKRAPFEPMTPGVVHVPYDDIEAMRSAVGPETAAVIVEPILGEAGVVVPGDGYLQAVREITTAAGVLMIVDEVQTGIARTGAWFGHVWERVEPDVVTLAKGLGGGFPIGACIAFGDAAQLLQPGHHGSTFGGNPLAATAALAVLDVIHTDDLVARAAVAGRRFMVGVSQVDHPDVAGVRGRGLLLGIGLTKPIAKEAVAAFQHHGFLVNAPADDVIRVAPPLIIDDETIDAFVATLPIVLEECR